MKITTIHLQEVGPLTRSFSLENGWTEEPETRVLFTGPNGCGKSILLRTVAMLWDAAGYWLDNRKTLPAKHETNVWLQKGDGLVIILDGIQPFCNRPVGLFFGPGDWFETLAGNLPETTWFGETITHSGKTKKNLIIPQESWFDEWAEQRKKMILSYDKAEGPNIIYLDAEERRWVTPKKNLSEPAPDDTTLRWLTRYQASDHWKGQLEASLNKGKPEWERNWIVVEAKGKTNVLEILKQKPDWLGIVDRDDWSEERIAEHCSHRLQGNSNLWVLPRFCIENYLIVPAELWAAFPPKQQAKVSGGLPELETKITSELDKWVAHGVLWSVVNPLWEGLRSLGFKEKLLDPGIIQDEEKIRKTLEEWHDFLDPDQIWEQYATKLDEVTPLDPNEKLKLWVHGKMFYKRVTNPLLDQLLGQKSAQDRKKSIFRTLPVPEEFGELFGEIG